MRRIFIGVGGLVLAAIALDCGGDAAKPSSSRVAPGGVTSFEPAGEGRVRAVVERSGVERTATVTLPALATEAVEVTDDTSHVAVKFALEGATSSELRTADGLAKYPGAVAGGDLVHRVSAEGTEDFVAFASRPTHQELVYRVDVSRVAGLRLVRDALEFLDRGGAPRLRVAPPYVKDAKGVRHPATLSLLGCAYDASPAPPWGRAVVSPGASSCGLRVAWADVAYPAVVDPAWTATGSLAVARLAHAASVLGSGKVLVVGGYDGGSSYPAGAELYDPATGTFAATGALATPRARFTANLLGTGKVLVVGGANLGGLLSSAELYDPTSGTFSATGSMAKTRYDHTASVMGNAKVLVAGGHGEVTAEIYDPSAGTFALTTGPMSVARYGHTASVLNNNKVLIAGGFDLNVTLASAELFDPIAGTFTTTASMSTPRFIHTATVLTGGRVLIAGGSNNGSFLGTAELYDPVAGTFAGTGSLVTARYGHTASVLVSGKILIAAGYNGLDLTAAELYDPIAGTFAATGSLAHPREGHTASVLGNGKVLVAGGGYPVAAQAELFGALDGDACTTGSDCVSGICNEKCCSATCTGACTTCSTTGACVPVTNADDPDTCTGTTTCDSAGACKKKSGQTCTVPGDCADGFCVGGVCCSTACTGGTCSGGVCVIPDAGSTDAGDDGGDAASDASSDDGGDAASDGGNDAATVDAGTDSGQPDSSANDGSVADAAPDSAANDGSSTGGSPGDAAADAGKKKSESSDSGGCSCELAGRTSAPRSSLALLFALAALAVRRGRRSRSRKV